MPQLTFWSGCDRLSKTSPFKKLDVGIDVGLNVELDVELDAGLETTKDFESAVVNELS